MNILGISGSIGWDGNISVKDWWVHGSSASLICNGQYIGSTQEERFTRVKHEGNYPQQAIEAILCKAGIFAEDIDVVAFTTTWAFITRPLLDDQYFHKKISERFPNADIVHADHHIAHAFASFYTSGFDRANVFTFDGAGDTHQNGLTNCSTFSTVSTSSGFVNYLTSYADNTDRHGPFAFGSFYSIMAFAVWASLHKNEEHGKVIKEPLRETVQGKVMGLSAYGNADNCQTIFGDAYYIHQDSSVSMPKVIINIPLACEIQDKIRAGHYVPFSAADLAAWAQLQFEKALIDFFKAIPDAYREENLCLGGGCSLNILANSKLSELGLYKNIHIHPAPGDEGLSIGAALLTAHQKGIAVKMPANIATVGISYSDKQVLEAIYSNKSIVYDEYSDDDLYTKVSECLVNNGIVAWHQGESEYGPRALCNRSILSNPCYNNKDMLNTKVKFRERWRPYAAVVMQEYMHDYVDIPRETSEYMLFSGIVKSDKREVVPGITHEDNTCRMQTVTPELNERAYKLLQAFNKASGIPMLLNTSFNTLPEEPIVETPEDAIRSFLYSQIDMLVINNFVITKPGA